MVGHHVVYKLSGQLGQGLSCQFARVAHVISERHKLHDISRHFLIKFLGIEWINVCVKLAHFLETLFANSHDDNRDRQEAASHYFVNRIIHIRDQSISDNEKYKVVVDQLVEGMKLGHISDIADNRSKVCRAVKLDLRDVSLVAVHYFVDSMNFGREDVPVHREAVCAVIAKIG